MGTLKQGMSSSVKKEHFPLILQKTANRSLASPVYFLSHQVKCKNHPDVFNALGPVTFLWLSFTNKIILFTILEWKACKIVSSCCLNAFHPCHSFLIFHGLKPPSAGRLGRTLTLQQQAWLPSGHQVRSRFAFSGRFLRASFPSSAVLSLG